LSRRFEAMKKWATTILSRSVMSRRSS
jgi:hypothetical protein